MSARNEKSKVASASFQRERNKQELTVMSIMLRGNRHSSRFNVRRQVQLILRAIVHARADFSRDPIETGEDARIGRLLRDKEERLGSCGSVWLR